jgi:hypothetical protein
MQIAELWVQNDIAMAGCQNWVCRCGTKPNYNEVPEGLPKDLAMTLYLQAIQKHLKEELSRKIDNIGVW